MDALHHDSFGDVLKALRKSKKISQQHLADKLGVHRNTIGAWERGDNLPDGKGMILELARILQLDQRETRHLLEASLTALIPYWNVPALHNPLFTGREDMLKALHLHLSPKHGGTLMRSYALHGLGGIGKTQLAVEYAYQHALDYNAVFWIGAESLETITASFLAIAELLKLPERQEADQQEIILAVQRWLMNHREWLLIWDNLEDVELLQRLLPPARQGAVLITTRSPVLGALAYTQELTPMTSEEGAAFLLLRTKIVPMTEASKPPQLTGATPLDYAVACELVQIMGGLPLALDQAGAYIEETGCSLADYLQRYQQQRAHLLARRGTLGGDHPHSVTTTFTLARQRLEQEQPIAADVLRVCALLHAEDIPEEVFVVGASSLGPALAVLAADPYRLDLALAALRSFALVQRQTGTHSLSMHRLVQAVLQEDMSEQEHIEWQQRVMRMLNVLFPIVTNAAVPRDAWKQCERLLPHALTCVTAFPDRVGDQHLVEVLLKVADYLREIGQYAQAEALYQRALTIGERILGPAHALIATISNNLATIYKQQGRYDEAEQLYQRAIRIREPNVGLNSRDFTSSLTNLAEIYKQRHKYDEAEPLFQRALELREQDFGADHIETALSQCFWANFWYDQRNYLKAERWYRKALAICEQALGPEHLTVARPLKGLADIYAAQEQYEQAEIFYRRTLAIRDQHVGRNHPETAHILHDLALCLQRQEKFEEAEEHLQRALDICTQSLGPLHAETVAMRTSYNALLQARDQVAEAASLEYLEPDALDGEESPK